MKIVPVLLSYAALMMGLFPFTAAPASPGLDIEDELNFNKDVRNKKKSPSLNEDKAPEETITDKDTTIEGDDEQYAPPKKSDIELPDIAEGRL
ncbi:MAG TPA: hypothetical protein PLY93_10790, partial [Turneriella sp.]|nr:hypothetical protein [Turneriella sp.]